VRVQRAELVEPSDSGRMRFQGALESNSLPLEVVSWLRAGLEGHVNSEQGSIRLLVLFPMSGPVRLVPNSEALGKLGGFLVSVTPPSLREVLPSS